MEDRYLLAVTTNRYSVPWGIPERVLMQYHISVKIMWIKFHLEARARMQGYDVLLQHSPLAFIERAHRGRL